MALEVFINIWPGNSGIGVGPQEHIDITYKTFKFSVKYGLKVAFWGTKHTFKRKARLDGKSKVTLPSGPRMAPYASVP